MELVKRSEIKSLSLFLICFLFLVSCKKEQLIEDYKIENISLGESSNNLISKEAFEEQIIQSNLEYDFRGDKFAAIDLTEGLKTYDQLGLIVKPDGKNNEIYAIYGYLDYQNIDRCYERQNELKEEFSIKYPNTEKTSGNKDFNSNSFTGEFRYFYFDFESGDRIGIQCYKYNESYYNLTIALSKKEAISWLSTYK